MSYYDEPTHNDPLEHRVRPHSGLGIASLAIAVIAGIIAFVLVGIAGYLEATTPGGIDEESPQAVLLGLGIFAMIGGSLLGGGLGIGGLLQKQTNSLFAVLGLVFNGLIVFGLLGLMAIGLAMQ